MTKYTVYLCVLNTFCTYLLVACVYYIVVVYFLLYIVFLYVNPFDFFYVSPFDLRDCNLVTCYIFFQSNNYCNSIILRIAIPPVYL